MTIHQPSSSLFYMFDKVLLLADGSTVYFGKASEVMNYLSSIGYAPAVPMNPADFLLDLANGMQLNLSKFQAEVLMAIVRRLPSHIAM